MAHVQPSNISNSTKTAHTAEALLNIHQDRETKVRRYYRQQAEARAYVTPKKQDVRAFLKSRKVKDRAKIKD